MNQPASQTISQELTLEPNLTDADGFYQTLIDMHQEKDAAQSEMINARLILLLANHIGDLEVLRQAMQIACQDE